MENSSVLNRPLTILKATTDELIILDGDKTYGFGTVPSAQNLILSPLFTFLVCSVSFFVFSGFSLIWHSVFVGTAIALFPFFGILLVRIYGGGRSPTYHFNKRSGTLTCSIPATFPYRAPKAIRYRLSEILDVASITNENDDPPPMNWRSIELRMQNNTLSLYTSDNAKIQQDATHAIRAFLSLQPLP